MIKLEYNNTHVLNKTIVLETEWDIPNMSQTCGTYSPENTYVKLNLKSFKKDYPYQFNLGLLMQHMLPSLIDTLGGILLYDYKSISKNSNELGYVNFQDDTCHIHIYMKKNYDNLFVFTRSLDYEEELTNTKFNHDIAQETEVDFKSQIEEFVIFLNTYLKDLHDDVPKIRKEVSDYTAYMQRVKRINEAAREMGIPVNDSYLD